MNTNQVQLYMRKNNMENLPPIYLPSGFGLHAHVNGEEKIWEDIIKKAFGSYFSFDFLKNGCDYNPEYT